MSEKIISNVESWKKSLLDITSRNQAINFRRRKSSTIQVIHPTMEDFLDKSITAKGLSFAEMFDDDEEDEEETLLDDDDDKYITVQGIKLLQKEVYQKEELTPVIKNFLSKKKGNFLFSSCNNKTQRKILRNLMKKARTFKEENAINVLYMAIGYLEWYESKDSDIKHQAPLMFLGAEITQDSIDAPFKISFPESDLLFNDSLLRKLLQDYKLDFNYDTDQDDMSNYHLYEQYKQLIYTKVPDKRWKIYDDLDLGIFSFSKINMVKDLEENIRRIGDSKLIQQLVGDCEIEESDRLYDEEEVDSIIKAEEYYHILDADSSQEIAIQSAISGKSFVLQGPPGTGKSQTITNIITELIARNKKVLFVAEKKAALDVVYNNLKKIGLNDYALPIHNSKLDKKEVLRELNRTLEKGQQSISVDDHFSNNQIHKYNMAKTQLIEYPKILLQKRYPINKSLYQLYGILLKYQNYPEVQFSINNPESYDEQKLTLTETVIRNFFESMNAVNYNPIKHPLYALIYKSLSIREKEDLKIEVKEMVLKLRELLDTYTSINLYQTRGSIFEYELIHFTKVLNHLKSLQSINKDLLAHDSIDNDLLVYAKLIEMSSELTKKLEQIQFSSDIEILQVDTDKSKRIVLTNQSLFKRLFSSDYRRVKNEVLLYTKSKKIKYRELLEILCITNQYKKMNKLFMDKMSLLKYKTAEMNLNELIRNHQDLAWMSVYKTITSNMDGIHEQDELSVLQNYLENRNQLNKLIDEFDLKMKSASHGLSQIKRHFDFNRINIEGFDIQNLLSYFEYISRNFDQIETILSFNYAFYSCVEQGLLDYCKKIINHGVEKHYQEIFYKRFYLLVVDHFLQLLLPNFAGSTLDIARGNFKEAELMIQKMARANIESNIVNKIPNYNGVEGYNVEVATLRSEASKSRRILPFRVLFNRIPNLITQLKPCLMMSPLSVSTYLRGTNIIFDTVIFDEASQVKPENAIGAIFRAKQFIVTGDKEQLPPTNFFQNVEDDENNLEENYDSSSFDSILDVSSSFISPIKLRWHYRSKFEELIRPSNKEIYKDLITFPSTTKPNIFEGIKFTYVNGLYYERKNELEAEKVIETLSNIIETYGTKKSVGVVTFNNEQQQLIEKKINHFRRHHSQYEMFFTNNEQEPFFVKNIETVQGDERDIIIISIGYGPDGKGKISMNFGPLNQANGYRRLNVAVTRAKSCLVLVTSIRGTDIDLNRTESRGARFLKHYLDYAEFGEDDKVDSENDLAVFDSPFEEDVYNELVNMGYEVRKQVGCSGYRIDLAVVNPNNPGNYLLGIECDGATYHSSQSVRDRDRLRQQVLEERNWIIYRIWSTDWIKNRKSQIEKLEKYIKGIDVNMNKPIVGELQVIPVVSSQKEQSRIEFDIYPNYEDLTKPHDQDLHNSQIQSIVLEIIKQTSPLHHDELKRIAPYFWGRQKYTSKVDENIKPILRSLQYKGEISLKGDHIIHKTSPVHFRETSDRSSRRDFSNIHQDELKDGILRILERTQKMNLDELSTMVVNLCGYQSISAKIREYLDDTILSLKRSKKVKLLDNQIELAVESV